MGGKNESCHLLENEEELQNGKVKSLWSDTNRGQKFTLLYSACGTIAVYLCQAVPTSFLARVVVSKGGEEWHTAAIMYSTYLFASIASPLFEKSRYVIPLKKCIWIGQFVLGMTQASLGFLAYTDDPYVLLVVGVLLKSIQGIGQGYYNVATIALLWHEIPDHVEKSFGMTKAMTSAGFLIGGVAGGYLYTVRDGMLIPFVVSGLLPFIISFFGWLIVPDIEQDEEETHCRIWSFILNPKSVIALGLASTSGAVFAVYSVSFTSYAQTMGVTVATVGVIFTTADGCAVLSTLLVSYYSNVNYRCREFFLLVFCLAAVGINLTFTSSETLPSLYIKSSILVMLAAAVRAMAFPEMIHLSLGEDKDILNNVSFRSKLSTVWYFTTTLPVFVFGISGTALQDAISYSLSLTISTLAGLALTLVSSGVICLYRCLTLKRTDLD